MKSANVPRAAEEEEVARCNKEYRKSHSVDSNGRNLTEALCQSLQ